MKSLRWQLINKEKIDVRLKDVIKNLGDFSEV